MSNQQLDIKFPKGGIFFIIIAVIAIIIVTKSAVTIGSGERGVLYKLMDDLSQIYDRNINKFKKNAIYKYIKYC